MKIKITILTENDIPASALNGIDEEQIKSAWQALLDLISVMPMENNDRATVLSAEFVEEEGEADERSDKLLPAQPEIEERTEESAQIVPKEDLISRKAAIDAIVDCTVYGNADELEEAVMQGNDWNRWSGGVLEALEAVKELPSAQPEIIYCKDCMHNGSFDTDCPIDWAGKNYCSFAERRDDDQDQ